MELYIHIPFCIRKCRYCDFLSFEGMDGCFEDYVKALVKELEGCRETIALKGLDTVFIGGGTPSILPLSSAKMLLDEVASLIEAGGAKCLEYTIEANPGTLTPEKLEMYKAAGISRLSIGLQSDDDSKLGLLGRIHDFEAFLTNYRMARKVGFDNINVDLMSGLPGQTCAEWEKTLRTVADLGPEHISAYSLIIEPGTPFFDIYGTTENACEKKGRAVKGSDNNAMPPLPDEDAERDMYHITAKVLGEYGYRRYEISNYARPGYESRHNLGYWTGAEYIGAGLGASSYEVGAVGLSAIRRRNTTDLKTYLKETVTEETTLLGKKDMIGEYMILRLRLCEGIERTAFRKRFNVDIDDLYKDIIDKYKAMGLMRESEGRISLTDEGIDVSNTIMADFLP